MNSFSSLGREGGTGDAMATPDSLPAPLLSIVVPAYNEEERIGATLKRMLAYLDAQDFGFEILVVSDGSSDRTRDVVNQVTHCRAEVRLIEYAPNRGKGYAVRVGMMAARGARTLFSDADLATPIEEIEKLFAAFEEGAEIAIGSRDTQGSELLKRQSFLREMGGRFFNKLVQLIAVPGVRDTQCGFKLFSRRASQEIFAICQIDHFAFDVEVLYLARKIFGYRFAEVPVRWAHQEGSKVRFFRDAWRMFKTLFRIRFTNYSEASATRKIPAP